MPRNISSMVKGHTIQKLLQVLIIPVIVSAFVVVFSPPPVAAQSSTQLFITEIQVSNEEFVEIHNPYDEPMLMSGWRLMYKGSGATELEVYSFNEEDIGPRGFIVLSRGYVEQLPGQVATFSRQLANTSGYLVLYNPLGQPIDLVGWGSGALQKQDEPASVPGVGQSIQRCFINGLIALSEPRSNKEELGIYNQMTPGQGVECITEEPEAPDLCTDIDGVQTAIPENHTRNEEGNCVLAAKCKVVVSEISAQPNYNGQEYVEVKNDTSEPMRLSACKLKINDGTERIMPDTSIQPGAYFAVPFANGTIRNAAGQITLITSEATEVIYEYPATNTSQSVNFDAGQTGLVTNYPTPSAANKANPLSEVKVEGVASQLADCGPGRYRSPETNRCRNIEVAAVLASCAADQERNPETNRCRKITSAASTLKPCAADQFRNPETNRCKKIATTSSTLQPCAPGQERNPETNRCRKIASSVSGTPLESTAQPAAISPFQYKTPVIGLLGTALLGYGAYEYRTDIRNYLQRVRESRRKGRPPG